MLQQKKMQKQTLNIHLKWIYFFDYWHIFLYLIIIIAKTTLLTGWQTFVGTNMKSQISSI